jgi:hypothetical protein
VANAYSCSSVNSSFRVNPWQMLYLVFALFHTHKPPKLASFLVGHLVISSGRKIIENFTKIMIGALATFFLIIIRHSN